MGFVELGAEGYGNGNAYGLGDGDGNGEGWGDGDGFGLLAGSKKTPGEAFAFLEMTQSTQVPK